MLCHESVIMLSFPIKSTGTCYFFITVHGSSLFRFKHVANHHVIHMHYSFDYDTKFPYGHNILCDTLKIISPYVWPLTHWFRSITTEQLEYCWARTDGGDKQTVSDSGRWQMAIQTLVGLSITRMWEQQIELILDSKTSCTGQEHHSHKLSR